MTLPSVIFHVGCPKTASTSIQSSLTKYRTLLLDQGYFYPLSAYDKHPEFALLASFDIFDSYRTYINFIPKSFDSNANIRDFFKSRISAYIRDFNNSKCHTLILSDEILPYYCNTKDKIDCLKSLFPFEADIHFIYYIRPPADMYISLYSTLVKVDQTNIWPHHFQLPSSLNKLSNWICSPEMFDHSSFISNIQAVFGSNSLSVFHYYEILKSPRFSSPVDHFFRVIGITPAFRVGCKSNPRLDFPSLFILCLFNRFTRIFSSSIFLHSFLSIIRSKILIPVLESFSSLSFLHFPSRRVLSQRHDFNQLFS